MKTAAFKAFPWTDVYSDRSERGNDASFFGSISRPEAFGKAIDQIAETPELKSIELH